jgi:hypothetical protein
MRRYSCGRSIFVQAENRVDGATRLESSGFLEVLTLEEQLCAAEFVDEARRHDWGAMDERLDPFVGNQHV